MTKAEIKKLDDQARYPVLLASPVEWGRSLLLPRDRHTIKGSVIKAIVERDGLGVIASVG